MTKLCLFLFGCVLFVAVTAQECPTAAVNDFVKCVEAAHKTKEEAEKKKFEEMKQKGEELKKKMETCFTSNGCTVPTKPPGGFGKHGGPGGSGGWKGKFGPRFGKGKSGSAESKSNSAGSSEEVSEETKNKTRACKEAVHNKIEERVQACVQAATGLTLPKFGGPKGPGGPHGPHGFGGPGGHPGFGGPKGPGGFHGFGGSGSGFGPHFGGSGFGPHFGGSGFGPHFGGSGFGPHFGGSGSGFGPHHGFGGPGGFGHHGGPDDDEDDMEEHKARAKEFVSKQCVNSSDPAGSTDKVIQCLNDTFHAAKEEFNKTMHSLDLSKPPAFFEQFCSAKNSCLATLNAAGCNESQAHEVFKKAAIAAFDCFKNETEKIRANKEDLAAGIDQCQGVNLTHAQKGPGGYKHPFGPQPGHFGGPGGGHGPGGMFHDPCDIFKGVPPPHPGLGGFKFPPGPGGPPPGGPHGSGDFGFGSGKGPLFRNAKKQN